MKTYKHIFEELLKEENITQCFHDAAKRKTTRPEVARVLKEEREVGNDRPEPQCLQEHVKALQKMLEEETYQPPEHKKMLINEYSCGKVREIIKPEFQYEHIPTGKHRQSLTRRQEKRNRRPEGVRWTSWDLYFITIAQRFANQS